MTTDYKLLETSAYKCNK